VVDISMTDIIGANGALVKRDADLPG